MAGFRKPKPEGIGGRPKRPSFFDRAKRPGPLGKDWPDTSELDAWSRARLSRGVLRIEDDPAQVPSSPADESGQSFPYVPRDDLDLLAAMCADPAEEPMFPGSDSQADFCRRLFPRLAESEGAQAVQLQRPEAWEAFLHIASRFILGMLAGFGFPIDTDPDTGEPIQWGVSLRDDGQPEYFTLLDPNQEGLTPEFLGFLFTSIIGLVFEPEEMAAGAAARPTGAAARVEAAAAAALLEVSRAEAAAAEAARGLGAAAQTYRELADAGVPAAELARAQQAVEEAAMEHARQIRLVAEAAAREQEVQGTLQAASAQVLTHDTTLQSSIRNAFQPGDAATGWTSGVAPGVSVGTTITEAPEIVIRYTPTMQRANAPSDANFLRFNMEWAQRERANLGINTRASADDVLRSRARLHMDQRAISRTGRDAMHPLDSILNEFLNGDPGSVYYFGNQSVNRSFGAQIKNELERLRDLGYQLELGDRVRVRFEGFPDYNVAPPYAPPASDPGL